MPFLPFLARVSGETLSEPDPRSASSSGTGPAVTLAVVVLNYNYADFVLDALDSVLTQSYPFDEVVVVDDGSTDDSLQRLRARGSGFRLVEQANQGPLAAARTGLAAVTSDYVYFLDADDRALPDLVATIRPVLVAAPVKVQFLLQGVDRDLHPSGSIFPALTQGYTAEQMRVDNRVLGFYTCPPTSGNVFRRATLVEMGLEALDPWESIDGVAAMVAPHLGEVATLVTPLAQYRVHGRNASRPWAPDVELLRGEVARFWERWDDAERLVGVSPPRPAPGRPAPAYVVERELMIATISDRPTAVLGRRFAAQVLRSRLPAADRVGLLLWVLALVQPVKRVRRSAVVQRRSAGGRSAGARRLVAAVRAVRRVRGSLTRKG